MSFPALPSACTSGPHAVTLQRLNRKQFDQFRDFIYQRCGIRIDSNKTTLLSNRVRRRLRANGMDDFDQYFRFLTSPRGAGEIDGFLDAITTNETSFFRTPNQFDWVRSTWIAEKIAEHRAGRRKKQLRIWSAGCSSGAEAYSLAICLIENRYRLRQWSLAILGTDISHEMLEIARLGSFKPNLIASVTPGQRRLFFDRDSEHDRWTVKPSVRELVRFKQHNLLRPIAEPKFDLIFIRNVLIYFDEVSKRTVVKRLLDAMASGAHLVIGPSEGITGLLGGLQRVSPLIYRKPGAEAGASGMPSSSEEGDR